MPVIASLSDIFGRSIGLTVPLVLLTIGSVLCCAASTHRNTMGTLLVRRCDFLFNPFRENDGTRLLTSPSARMWGLIYCLPFYFRFIKAFNPISTGLSTLPALQTATVGAAITGRLVTRLRTYLVLIRAGWLLAALACALTATWRFVGSGTAMLGLGHGLVLNAGNFATRAMCAPGDGAHAAATYLFLRQLGAAVGVGGSAFQNATAARLGHGSELKGRITDAYEFGFGDVFALYPGVAGIALILSLILIKHFPLDKELSSEHRLETNKVTRIFDGGRPATMVEARRYSATPDGIV
ncbi:hypothetical protein DL767_011202 [Monosporascus sp. MG133]|nr:hypothetical protein DL767_011202 [Monosporascus sp. MG133]